MYRLFLCLRYFFKRRIALFAISAVTLSVALLIVITSLFHGFVNAYLSHTDRVFGQIVFYPAEALTDYRDLADQFGKIPSVRHVVPIVRTGALLYLGRGNVRAVQVIGADLEVQCQEPAFRSGLLFERETPCSFEFNADEKRRIESWLTDKLGRSLRTEDWPVGAVLGIGLFGEPDEASDLYDTAGIQQQLVELQHAFTITTGYASRGLDNEAQSAEKRSGLCWPVNVVQTGLNEADTNFIYLPFDYVAKLAGSRQSDGRYACHAEIQIQLHDGADSKQACLDIQAAWNQYAHQMYRSDVWLDNSLIVVSSQSVEVGLFTAAINQQLAILQLILSLICMVVVTLVFVILLMIVYEKRRDVGILRSIGASRSGIAVIFVGYGAIIGVIGAMLGLALGAAATHYIAELEAALSHWLGFKIWRSGVYMFQEIPNQIAWQSVWAILLVGIGSAMLGALLPAIRAARMQPVQALRYE